MNVLVMGSIFPAPIPDRELENDIQLVTARYHEERYPDVNYFFLLLVPYTNKMLSNFSDKWKGYYKLRKEGSYIHDGKKIYVLSYPVFKRDRLFRNLLGVVAYHIHKRSLKRILNKYNIDLVLAQGILLSGILANNISKSLNVPYIVTTRGLWKSKKNDFPISVLSDARATINLNFFDFEIASKQNRNSFLVPHGLSDVFLNCQKDYKGSVQKPIRVVTLCRLLQLKNIDKVLYALKESSIDFIFHIYGEGPDHERLASLVNMFGFKNRVIFKGFAPYDKVPSILSMYDVFVMPSFPETLGRAFFEAMACGLPVIGTRGCGIDGYIENGKEGFLINHADVEELSDVLKRLANDRTLLEEMGKNAKRLTENYTWNAIIDKIDKIYRDALS